MNTKKTAPDLSGLLTPKGTATPQADIQQRSAPTLAQASDAGNELLNFRVTAEFKREFKTYAASHDMKLNALLYAVFNDYKARNS